MFGGCAVAVYGVHYWGSQSTPQSMAPETHTRYRVQRLIRLGEWLERNEAALIMAFDVIDDAHELLIDPPEDMPASDSVEIAGFKMLQPLMAMQKMLTELRHDLPTRQVRMGEDVTIHQPFALPGKEWQVVIEAPTPKDIPSQEEFDKVRSEVDGI